MIDRKILAIKKKVNNSPDIVYRKVKIKRSTLLLVFNTSTADTSSINEYILNKLTFINKKVTRKNILNHLDSTIPHAVIEDIKDENDLFSKLNSGFCLIFFSAGAPIAIETKKDLSRSVSEPLTEQSISGPKDAFVENYETNLGLVRKRVKTNDLVIKEVTIGKQSRTKIAILYMDNICDKDMVHKIEKRLEKINIDGIFDSTSIGELINDKNSIFPTITTTERPDTTSFCLLEGKVCIMVENSPYALVIPTFFSDLFHASEDNYANSLNVSITRIIRYLAFIIAVTFPAIYIAVITYNHETIPVTLLANFSAQRDGVPFPAIIEALGLTLVFEILRESDIRMPHLAGTAISILGAIVLGDAAVAAGIVSPIMVIVISLSAIASLMFSNVGMVNAIRLWKIIFMLFATTAGLVGVFIAMILLIVDISSLGTFDKPFLYPIIPFNKKGLKNAFIKSSIRDENERLPILSRNKEREK